MFNVPEFICEQQLRIRTKIHKRNDSNGYCKLSVTVSCQPKNIKKLIDSNFSLDDISKLPINLIYINSNPIQSLNWKLCIHNNTTTQENNIEMQGKIKDQPEVKLNNLSRDKLIQLCKERKIKGYSKLKKQEIHCSEYVNQKFNEQYRELLEEDDSDDEIQRPYDERPY